MSEYRNFERCVICRSYKNIKDYHGDFEETMLINTLYMTVMFPIEFRQKGMIKAKQIVEYLNNKGVIETYGNAFNSDDIVRCLRNALAHFNVMVESYNGKVTYIRLWAKNQPKKTICKSDNACDTPKCIPRQYLEDENGEICTFVFTLRMLREFTFYVIEHTLTLLPREVCSDCEYNSK